MLSSIGSLRSNVQPRPQYPFVKVYIFKFGLKNVTAPWWRYFDSPESRHSHSFDNLFVLLLVDLQKRSRDNRSCNLWKSRLPLWTCFQIFWASASSLLCFLWLSTCLRQNRTPNLERTSMHRKCGEMIANNLTKGRSSWCENRLICRSSSDIGCSSQIPGKQTARLSQGSLQLFTTFLVCELQLTSLLLSAVFR